MCPATSIGTFCAVSVNDCRTLDMKQGDGGELPVQHFCFASRPAYVACCDPDAALDHARATRRSNRPSSPG
jgi:hypothetical protein